MNPQILYTTRSPKPQPTPASTKAPAPKPNRITLGWGQSDRLHIPRSKAPESDRQPTPKRELGDRTQPIPLEMTRTQIDRNSKLERRRRQRLLQELLEQSSNRQPGFGLIHKIFPN